MTLVDDWQINGLAIPIVGCGNPWHYTNLDGAARQQDSSALRLLEAAWGIIANAGGGDWTSETRDWQDAAPRWRDEYHAILATQYPTRRNARGRSTAHD